MDELQERQAHAERLRVTQSNFAAAMRACQIDGLSARAIGEQIGLKATTVRQLIIDWGLDT